VFVVAKDKDRFMHGRAGDHLVTQFQCDLCNFRNMQRRNPTSGNARDDLLMRCIRRANLDAFWSREAETVRGNLGNLKSMCAKAQLVGLDANWFYPPMGPLPVQDNVGMGLAVCVLLRTLDPGINERTIQFNTAAGARTAYNNMWHASAEGGKGAVVARETAKLFVTTAPALSDWFERFMLGAHKRMGDKHVPDLAISIDVLLELMSRCEVELKNAGNNEAARGEVILFATFCVVGFCCALRGEELPLMDLAGTRKHYHAGMSLTDPMKQHCVVALLGRFKTETGEKYHLMPLVLETASGLKPALWICRMVEWYEREGVTSGPVFRRDEGQRIRSGAYDFALGTRLSVIQLDRPDLINPSVEVYERIKARRSLRRGSDSQALAQNVNPQDIDINNRWRSFEQAKGRKPKLRMQHHYADVMLILPALLRYSRPL
jgi:hypothetical protein